MKGRHYEPADEKPFQKVLRRKNDRVERRRLRNVRSDIDQKPPVRPWNVMHNPKRQMLMKERADHIAKANRKMVGNMLDRDRLVEPVSQAEEQMRRHVLGNRRVAREQKLMDIELQNADLLDRLLNVKTHFDRKKWRKDAQKHEKIGRHMSRYAVQKIFKPKRRRRRANPSQLPPIDGGVGVAGYGAGVDAYAAHVAAGAVGMAPLGAAAANRLPQLHPQVQLQWQAQEQRPGAVQGQPTGVGWQVNAANVLR